MLAFRILFDPWHGCLWLCPESRGAYREGSGVVFTSFKPEWEGVLTWWDEGPSEAVENVLESCDDSSACESSNFDDILTPPHILVLGELIMILILAVGTVHPDVVVLTKS